MSLDGLKEIISEIIKGSTVGKLNFGVVRLIHNLWNNFITIKKCELYGKEYCEYGVVNALLYVLYCIKNSPNELVAINYTINALFNCSQVFLTRQAIKQSPLYLDVFETLVRHDDQTISLLSSFIVSLVNGDDENGRGYDIIEGNRVIPGAVILYDIILDNEGRALGCIWDFNELALVLENLSKSERNRRILANHAIPVLIKALQRAPTNMPCIKNTVITMERLCEDIRALKLLQTNSHIIQDSLNLCLKTDDTNIIIQDLIEKIVHMKH